MDSINHCFVKNLFFILFFSLNGLLYSQNKSNDDLKIEANKLFENEDYTTAYKLYSQLVANYPKDPVYNFKLGVCMIYSEPDKNKCLPFLTFANSKSAECPPEVKFYLGKAYHIIYRFDEAIKYYEEYKLTGNAANQKKLQVDREITSCKNGKQLLSSISDLEIKSKKQLNEADYFRSYDLKNIGGKLLIKPELFRTSADKKKKEKSVVFLPSNSDKVYFSSYGENISNKDIFYAQKSANGEFGKPIKLSGINTDYDEDYPFLHPNGKTLYFASKGHNGMGGYDIFKSNYNEESDSWSQPENLEFPINSPDDDYLFVTDSSETIAYFSTGRQSPPGKIDVLKINTERKVIDILVLKGTILKETDEQSVESKITVKNLDNGEIIGEFQANNNGDYSMNLPNGAKLLFTVETPGLNTQSDNVGMPLALNSKPLRQTISYVNGTLEIINYFNEVPTEDSYLQYLSLIEEKSKLNVNEGKNKTKTSDDKDKNEIDVNPQSDSTQTITDSKVNTETENTIDSTTSPDNSDVASEVNNTENSNSETANSVNPNESNNIKSDSSVVKNENEQELNQTSKDSSEVNLNINNNQLVEIANTDAKETQKEADKLLEESITAENIGNSKKIEATNKLNEADSLINLANNITDENEKNSEIEKATAKKTEAESELEFANKIIAFSESIKQDAENKQKEANLNKEYAEALSKINSTNNSDNLETQDKINQLQNEIKELSNKTTEIENFNNNSKSDLATKENTKNEIETNSNTIKSEIEQLKNQINEKEIKLKDSLDTSDKSSLENEINDIKTELTDKEEAVKKNEIEIAKINNDIKSIKDQLEYASKVKINVNPEPIANNLVNTSNSNTVTLSTQSNNTTEPEKNKVLVLQNKYKNNLTESNNNNPESLKENNKQLSNYNKEIDLLITDNKKQISTTKSQNKKQQLSAEISELEKIKKTNNQTIALNKIQIQNLNPPASPKNNQIAKTTKTNNTVKKNPTVKNNTPIAKNNVKNVEKPIKVKAGLNTIVAKTSTDAINNLNTLNNELNKNESGNFEYNSHQNTEAQKLKIEADAKINEAIAQQKKLQEIITSTKNKIQNSNTTNIASINLSSEAEELTLKAQGIRLEANSKSDSEKVELLTEAKKLEEIAIEKNIQASEVTVQTNNSIFEINNQNLSNLILQKKSSPADINKSKQLNKDADLLFKQAKVIRIEAQKLNSKGALLGNLSNAEEKEAIAIEKQKEALNILTKSNPNFVLKTATSKQPENKDTLNSKLAEVNSEINNLVITKTEAYSKLYEANNLEISDLINGLNNNAKINSNFKTEFTTATKKYNDAEVLKQRAGQNQNKNEALNDLISASKLQTESLNQLNNLNKKAENAVVANSNKQKNQTINQTENNNKKQSQPNANKDNYIVKATDTKTISLNEITNSTDTTANQIVNYFENKNITLSNNQANELKNKAYELLKKSDEELINTLKQENNNQSLTQPNNDNSEKLEKLNKKSDSLATEVENLNNQISEMKNNAESLSDSEKDSVLNLVANLEKQLNITNSENYNTKKEISDLNFTSLANKTEGLLNRIKNDNTAASEDFINKKNQITEFKNQIDNLRKSTDTISDISLKSSSISEIFSKESELSSLQNQLFEDLKNQYPDYDETNQDNSLSNINQINYDSLAKAKQFNELTNLTNALSLEFETLKSKIPGNLNDNEQQLLVNANDLNNESKQLLIKASNESDSNQKTKLISLSAKMGLTAIEQLSKFKTNVIDDTDRFSRTNNQNNRLNSNPENTINNNQKTELIATTKIEGLEIIPQNQNVNKPIPLDTKMPDGLFFRVQIGAFKTQLTSSNFKGLNPLNAETAGNGYIRYTAGEFKKFENANAVKNDLRKIGYPDAFIVAYKNGKRITNAEAATLLSNEGIKIDIDSQNGAGIISTNNKIQAQTTNIPEEKVTVTKELEQVNGLLFTIQIGVYNRQVNKFQLRNLTPIFTEKLPTGLYRYTAGIYNNTDKVITDKKRVVDLGINDAFVSAYLNGKKITFADAKNKKENDASISLEPENPIIFPQNNINIDPTSSEKNTETNSIQTKPFTNGVSSYPQATAENGIKDNENGICFKVQIGAYSKQVPNDVAEKFSSIKTWPVEYKLTNGLYIYNIGNFSDAKFAKTLKDQAVSIGINDAFITVYKNGQKLYGAEASLLLGQ